MTIRQALWLVYLIGLAMGIIFTTGYAYIYGISTISTDAYEQFINQYECTKSHTELRYTPAVGFIIIFPSRAENITVCDEYVRVKK